MCSGDDDTLENILMKERVFKQDYNQWKKSVKEWKSKNQGK